MKYYHVHVKYESQEGFSVWFMNDFPAKPNFDDIVAYALDSGKIDVDDGNDVDEATEVSKKEYLQALKHTDEWNISQ